MDNMATIHIQFDEKKKQIDDEEKHAQSISENILCDILNEITENYLQKFIAEC